MITTDPRTSHRTRIKKRILPPRRRKQVTNEPNQFRGDHTFVNKDASNIDTKDHYAAVSWHVMNRYEKWKKQGHAMQSTSSWSTPTSPSKVPSIPSALTDSQQAHASASATQSLVLVPTSPGFHSPSQYPPQPWRLESVEQSVLSTHFRNTAIISSPSTQTPPFPDIQTIHPVEFQLSLHSEELRNAQYPSLVNRILRFVREVVIPNAWPQETERVRWIYELSRAADDVSDIYGDILFASASLCLYATVLASFSHDTELASAACFWQMQAMDELSQRIENDAGRHNLYTMRAMLKLFSAETSLGNTATARVHLKMLRSIIQSQGGVLLLESWFRENLLAADCYFALKCETRPLFAASEWSPGPLSQPWRHTLSTIYTLDKHGLVVGVAVEHVQLRTVITDLRELFRVKQYIDLYDIQVQDQLLRWYQLRKHECINRLADHQLNLRLFPHMFPRPKLHTAICTAIALMTIMVLGSPAPIRSGIKLCQELKMKLNDTRAFLADGSAPDNEDEVSTNYNDGQHLMFWMLYVGSLAQRIHASSLISTNFESALKEMAASLALQTNEQQRAILGQCLFSSDLTFQITSGRPRQMFDTVEGLYESCGTSWRMPLQGDLV